MSNTADHSLWAANSREALDPDFARFNVTLPCDQRLFECDIRASQAYAEALNRVGVLSDDEAATIHQGLVHVLKDVTENPAVMENAVKSGVEDIHTFVEARLYQEIGGIALKLNTGRSRNDQVSTDLRLWLVSKVPQIRITLCDLQKALLNIAEQSEDIIMPGYTHLQRAQPVLWCHYLLAYFEMFERDKQRLTDSLKRIDVLTLGAGAIAGNSFSIDRKALAKELGFTQISANSMDAVSDRDFVIELSGALGIIAMHLSRLAEDMIIFSTAEFGFVELGDSVTTGSSLMPQKKNPDSLELIRGKTARVFGNHMALLTLMKGLPLTYNKDMAEDKELLFNSIDTVLASLVVMTKTIGTIRLNETRISAALNQSEMNATEVADYLVRKGVAFRQAHEIVAQLVAYARSKEKLVKDLCLADFQQFYEGFDSDVFHVLTVNSAINSKSVVGGTAKSEVIKALRQARERLGATR